MLVDLDVFVVVLNAGYNRLQDVSPISKLTSR